MTNKKLRELTPGSMKTGLDRNMLRTLSFGILSVSAKNNRRDKETWQEFELNYLMFAYCLCRLSSSKLSFLPFLCVWCVLMSVWYICHIYICIYMGSMYMYIYMGRCVWCVYDLGSVSAGTHMLWHACERQRQPQMLVWKWDVTLDNGIPVFMFMWQTLHTEPFL